MKNCQSASKESTPSSQNVIFKSIINTFKFKGRKNNRNCHTSYLRSKNDSLNDSENGGIFKSKFEKLKAIQDDEEESKLGQVNSLENQALLASKLADLQEYNSCQQSIDNGDIKMRSSNLSYSSGFVSSGDKSPSSNVLTPVNAINFQGIPMVNYNTSAKSSGIVN